MKKAEHTELPDPESLNFNEREQLLRDSSTQYMNGDISCEELSRLEDIYGTKWSEFASRVGRELLVNDLRFQLRRLPYIRLFFTHI